MHAVRSRYGLCGKKTGTMKRIGNFVIEGTIANGWQMGLRCLPTGGKVLFWALGWLVCACGIAGAGDWRGGHCGELTVLRFSRISLLRQYLEGRFDRIRIVPYGGGGDSF